MHWKILPLICGGLSLIVILVSVRSVRLPPRSYGEAVMQELDARHIPYETVEVTVASCHPCTGSHPPVHPLSARVTIIGTQPATEWMSCKTQAIWNMWTDCKLWINAFDLKEIPLQPVITEAGWRMVLHRYWYRLRTRFSYTR